MAYVDFPRQKLSRRKKTQKWGEECIESAFQSDNDKIVEMAKKYKINKIVRRKDG